MSLEQRAVFFVFLGLFAWIPAHATSGACSDHGGVNCSYESGIYAVCNDMTVSSVPYDDMEECQQEVTCNYPAFAGCSEAQYENLESEEAQATNGAQYRGIGYSSDEIAALESQTQATYSQELSECQSEIAGYNAAVAEYNQCNEQKSQEEAEAIRDETLETTCVNGAPANAIGTYSDGNCTYSCKEGYTVQNGSCALYVPPPVPVVVQPIVQPPVVPSAVVVPKAAATPKPKAAILATTTTSSTTSVTTTEAHTVPQPAPAAPKESWWGRLGDFIKSLI